MPRVLVVSNDTHKDCKLFDQELEANIWQFFNLDSQTIRHILFSSNQIYITFCTPTHLTTQFHIHTHIPQILQSTSLSLAASHFLYGNKSIKLIDILLTFVIMKQQVIMYVKQQQQTSTTIMSMGSEKEMNRRMNEVGMLLNQNEQ